MRTRSFTGFARRAFERVLPLGVAVWLGASLVVAAPSPGPAAAPAVAKTRHGAATESRQASETALQVLARGGTAVDAAVAASLVAGVVAPTSSGLGGGGFALVYRAEDRSFTVLDFREAAPAVLDTAAFDRRPLPDAERGKLTGVPGEVRGLAWLHQKFGKLAWGALVEPAERLARDGFPIEPHLASVIGSKDDARYRRMRAVESSFWPGGKGATLGQRVKRPELARTLHTLRTEGPESFYAGPIADDLVAAARQFGGTLTREDLARYRPRELTPLRVTWGDYEVVTMPPPSAGGLFLATVLGSFSKQELALAGLRTGLGVHQLAEVMRGALADRARYIGDPGINPVDVARLLAPARLAARKARIVADRTQAVQAFANEDHGTHALVVADARGNVVSLTTTVNTAFGAEIEGERTGIVLNDELDDFTSPTAAAKAGVRFPPNLARPGVRPTSSMTPTIVLRAGVPVLALGGSGGYTIPPSVTQTLLDILVGNETPAAAVAAPRFRFDASDYSLTLDDTFGDAVRQDLERRGEKLRVTVALSAVQVLAFGPRGVTGAADPRKGGAVLVR